MRGQTAETVKSVDRKMLGKRLREERLRLGLTQEEVGARVDVSATYIGYIERGERSVTLEKLVLLAQCFGVTLDSLLTERAEQAAGCFQREKRLRSLLESTSPDEKELILTITEAIVGRRG